MGKRSLRPEKQSLPSSRYAFGVTASHFAQLVTRWLSGDEPVSMRSCFLTLWDFEVKIETIGPGSTAYRGDGLLYILVLILRLAKSGKFSAMRSDANSPATKVANSPQPEAAIPPSPCSRLMVPTIASLSLHATSLSRSFTLEVAASLS